MSSVLRNLSAAMVRSLSGQPGVFFRGDRLVLGGEVMAFRAAHLMAGPDEPAQTPERGLSDAHAMRLLFSDLAIHAQARPAKAVSAWLMDAFEQFRVESLVPTGWPGSRANLQACFEAWSLSFFDSGLCETQRGLALYTIVQMVRSRLTGEPVVSATEDFIEGTRAKLSPILGGPIAHLRKLRNDQAAFAVAAAQLALQASEWLDDDGLAETATKAQRVADEARQFMLLLQLDQAADDKPISLQGGRSAWLDAQAAQYQVYTREFDREVRGQDLAREAQLREWRAQLDHTIGGLGINVNRLARALLSQLAVPQAHGWQDAQELGRIDARRLGQLIASPQERHLFRNEPVVPRVRCVVSLLIDCSGSMRQHQMRMACIADLLARALDLAGIPSEILGFTTGAWNGGRALQRWRAAGESAGPGRLNEQTHIVFKDASTPWRRARLSIAALLKNEMYREGVDGEAVLWATQRSRALQAERRVLWVFSDGCPMDGATSAANDEHYLDHHLQQVVAQILGRGDIALGGVGLGQDLSFYYPRHYMLNLEERLHLHGFLPIIQLAGSARA
jgi:cobaltochelatase CobT